MENFVPHNTPPPRAKWHIHLEGDPEDLVNVIQHEQHNEKDVFLGAFWVEECEVVICLHWIDDVIARLAAIDIENRWPGVRVRKNGRDDTCQAHQL